MNSPRAIPRLCRLALLGCWLALASLARGDEPKSAGEYQVKAVFLYNFTRFVEWPETAFVTTNSPLVIGVLGDDPFGPVLDEAVRGEVVHNHPLSVTRFRRGESISGCHILFVSRSERERLGEIAGQLRNSPTLLVADTQRAAERGAMINLTTQENVRMEINLSAAENAGLRMSSKLLGIAKVVSPSGRGVSP
ncbi:MAG TPA: YfiR family protein [Candidatus Paceibacterota bacterium]|nr:YfiR family protein [Candidatus Paceibacterota bacterium]